MKRWIISALVLVLLTTIPLNAQQTQPDNPRRYDDLDMGITDEGYPRLGNPDAPVEVRLYSSFGCPPCAAFNQTTLDNLVGYVYIGQIRLVFVPVTITGHLPNTVAATRAAFCASEQNAFWSYQDLLFEWHRELNDRAFTHERLNLGSDLLELDRNKFNECLASDRPDALIDSITQEITAPNSGFEGTPSLMINGRMVQGSPTWAVLKSKIFDMVRAVNP